MLAVSGLRLINAWGMCLFVSQPCASQRRWGYGRADASTYLGRGCLAVLWDVADDADGDAHGVSLPSVQSLVVFAGVAFPNCWISTMTGSSRVVAIASTKISLCC